MGTPVPVLSVASMPNTHQAERYKLGKSIPLNKRNCSVLWREDGTVEKWLQCLFFQIAKNLQWFNI